MNVPKTTMKKITCKDMGGVCNEVFEGNTYREVGEKGGAHIMSTTDEAHAKLREQLTTSSEAEKNQWWEWFRGEWDKKK